MEFKASFAKIVGTPQEGRDSWVYVEDGFFLVLELCGSPSLPTPERENQPFSIAVRGKEVIDSLVSGFHSLSNRNLDNLKELVAQIKLEDGLSLSLVLGVQVGRALYLICRGAGRVTARREGKFATILSEDGCASGILKNEDIFLLSSSKFSEIVSFDEVKAAFDSLGVSELAESLTPLVHRTEDTSGVAALIIQFKEIVEEWRNEGEEKKETVEPQARTNFLSVLGRFRPIVSYPLSLLRRSSAIYLRTPQGEEEKRRRIIFGVVTILAVLLGLSIILGISKKISNSRQDRFTQTYNLTLRQYEEAKALLGLNNLRATSLFTDAKTSLEKLAKDWPKNSTEANKIADLQAQIGEGLGEAGQIYKVTPEVFLDLNLVKEGAWGRNLSVSGGNMVVSDNKNSALYQVNIEKKSSQILAGGESLAGAGLVSLSGDKAYVLTNNGVVEVGQKSKAANLTIKKDSEWGEIKALVAFSGNLYLLNATKVWKYAGTESGFAPRKSYFVGEPNLGSLSSMAIDGSVWVTASKILKFTQGKQEDFNIQGLDKELDGSLLISTSDEVQNLYILDKTGSRVVVLDKTGNYKSQYILDKIGDISDLAVSEEAKKIFLLVGSKIYMIGLR